MKFNPFSDKETCSEVIKRSNHKENRSSLKRDIICMRIKGHSGDHIPEAGKAGEADGVRWCCRVKLDQNHTDWCPLQPDTAHSSTG